MDIQRPSNARAKKIRRIIYGTVTLLLLGGVTYGLSKLRPAAPSADRATVWPDEVKRGPMVRDVHGLGTLVPEDIRWIPAQTDSRAERWILRPGRIVKLESERTAVAADSAKARLAAQQAKIDEQKALYQLKKSQVDALHVRAGINGVLQLVPVDVGQHVTPWTNLARVADPKKLKAEIK